MFQVSVGYAGWWALYLCRGARLRGDFNRINPYYFSLHVVHGGDFAPNWGRILALFTRFIFCLKQLSKFCQSYFLRCQGGLNYTTEFIRN